MENLPSDSSSGETIQARKEPSFLTIIAIYFIFLGFSGFSPFTLFFGLLVTDHSQATPAGYIAFALNIAFDAFLIVIGAGLF